MAMALLAASLRLSLRDSAAEAPINSTAVEWLKGVVEGNLESVQQSLRNASAHMMISRDLPSGALSALMMNADQNAAAEAMVMLRKFGDRTDMSFGGQAWPAIWHGYKDVLNSTDRDWLFAAINRSLPATQQQATPQEVSYTNMWLMSTVNSVLFGEIAGGTAGKQAATIGYSMLDQWLAYTHTSGLHEFTSPTYTYVQLTALYAGYIHAARPEGREGFGRAIDYIWTDTCANYFAPQGALSGPHSRDYDYLVGHGMLDVEMYIQGLPDMYPMTCERRDPHCEGPVSGATKGVGTGEPMTIAALSYYNLLHPMGYRLRPLHTGTGSLPARANGSTILALAYLNEREVQSRFLGEEEVSANGVRGRFATTYNYIRAGVFAMGSASADYITNTHSKYFPNMQEKPLNVLLGPRQGRYNSSEGSRPLPGVILVPDWQDEPYGLTADDGGEGVRFDKASHLALHPGMVQKRNVLLSTVALNGNDTLDGFTLTPRGNLYQNIATNLILPRDADQFWLRFANGTGAEFHLPTADTASPTSSTCSGGFCPFSVPLPMPITLGVRVDEAAMCVKVFVADRAVNLTRPGSAKQNQNISSTSPPPSAPLFLKGDVTGLDMGAIRLAAYHLPPNSTGGADDGVWVGDSHLRFAALMVAEEVRGGGYGDLAALCERVATAETASAIRTADPSCTEWLATAKFGETSLRVGRNLTCSEQGGFHNQTRSTQWDCLTRREVDGAAAEAGPLRVNGNVASPI